MPIELITGRAGKAHIGSEDDRAYHAYTAGSGRYILNGGGARVASANSIHINPAEILADGAHIRITGTGEEVNIDNGASSYKRIDVIALHYTRTGGESDYVENIELVAVKGTPADSDPTEPEMPKTGSLLDDVAETYFPLYSVLIDGLTPQEPQAKMSSYALPVDLGGTGASTLQALRKSMGLGDTTGALPIENGGTGATTAAAARNALGLGNTTGALPIENGGTGQTTLETAVAKMCGIGFGASKKITDCMNIDLSNPYSATNLPCIIGAENASTLASCPVTSGAFYAQRTVYPIKADDGRYHFIVYLHEMWPEPWRVWAASYNKDYQKWDGWHQISTRMESKPQFANDMMIRSLGGAIHLDNGTDLNNVKTPGTYCVTEHVNAQTIGNAPTKYSFKLIVEYNAGNSFYIKQTFTDLYFNTYVRKTGDGGQWENWVQTSAAYASLDGAMPVPYSQMGNAVAMFVQTADLTDEQAITVSTLYPEWKIGMDYEARQIVRDGGHLFRCAQKHTSSEQNNTSVASLWTKIDKAGDGVDVWQQPSGAHDAYNKGDRVHYPDADGPIYVSLIDGNTWSPDAYPDGWELEGGAE